MGDKLAVYKETKEAFEKKPIGYSLDETSGLLEQTYYNLYHIAKSSPGIRKDHLHHLSKLRLIADRAQKIGEIGKCLEDISKFVIDETIYLV